MRPTWQERGIDMAIKNKLFGNRDDMELEKAPPIERATITATTSGQP